jgi:hypothetical protein
MPGYPVGSTTVRVRRVFPVWIAPRSLLSIGRSAFPSGWDVFADIEGFLKSRLVLYS